MAPQFKTDQREAQRIFDEIMKTTREHVPLETQESIEMWDLAVAVYDTGFAHKRTPDELKLFVAAFLNFVWLNDEDIDISITT